MNRYTGFLVLVTALVFLCPPNATSADPHVCLNAFRETAVAYMNDAFLLLGTGADAFTADVIPKEQAVNMTANVQNRLRIIRAKFKAVAATELSGDDRRLLLLVDDAYACMDREAWALLQHLRSKSRDSAKRFDDIRRECLQKIEQVAAFMGDRPAAPKVQEPLSTR
jgi:hypothetical protein